jgi:NO-binding membrane sensor protein with MHYT domain
MGHMQHFSYGLLTPVLSYLAACTGAAVGLRCTVRALRETGRSRRNWLMLGATAIGSGIWTMHFIAMLGFGVSGSVIRYDVPLTLISLGVAIVVVGAGVFTVGYGEATTRSLLLGGVGTGLGVATMHYTGMAAVRVNGAVGYNTLLVVASVVIAIVAATAALWIVTRVQDFLGAMIAALVMGLAVSSMHYTAMAALRVDLHAEHTALSGATALQFILPLTIGMAAFLCITSVMIAVSPMDEDPVATSVPALDSTVETTDTWTWRTPLERQDSGRRRR